VTAQIDRNFSVDALGGRSTRKSALLIAPPIYDTQYWAEWSQPTGLLRVAALLKKHRYKKLWLYDFMEADSERGVHDHRINPDDRYDEENLPHGRIKPITIEKSGERLELYKRHFGKTWDDFEVWLRRRGLTSNNPPNEVWISPVMTYWWESTRDLTLRLRRYFGKRTRIILGGIYPTLAPDHAASMTAADIVVSGEIEEANELWTDLSLYRTKPSYAIITPSRGCPYDCSYCAQKTINAGVTKVRFRKPSDVVAEMRNKYEKYGIRDFAFYADFLLINFRMNIIPILQEIIAEKLPFRLYAPEGLDTRFLSQSQELLDLMKAAHFQKIYLPVESIDDNYVRTLNRRHVKLEHFVKAAAMCEKAGFRLRNMDVNGYVLYGLPGESIDRVVRTSLFVSEIVGSIIPMLFSPVPSTGIFEQYLPYFKERGWDKNLQFLNGKLFPFIGLNEGSISDYVDLQRLMFTLNAHYRGRSYRLFGGSRVNKAMLENVRNGFEAFVSSYRQAESQPQACQTPGEAKRDIAHQDEVVPGGLLPILP